MRFSWKLQCSGASIIGFKKIRKKCVADFFRMATAQMVLISLCPQIFLVSSLIFLPRSIILSPTYAFEQTTCYVISRHWYLRQWSLCFEYTDRLLECYAQHCGVRETCVANKSLCVYLRGGSRRRCSQFQITVILSCTFHGNTCVLFI